MKKISNPMGAGLSVRKPKALSSSGHKEAIRLAAPFSQTGKGRRAYGVLSRQILAIEQILANGLPPRR